MRSAVLKKRTQKGYDTFLTSSGNRAYILKRGKIAPGCRLRGIWQFEMAVFRGKSRPFLFFTCPECGEINRDLVSRPLIQSATYYHGGHIIRGCHACRFCRAPLPYTLDDPEGALKELNQMILSGRRKEAL